MPRDFGLRYIAWFLWSHAITGLSILQAVFASVLLAADGDPNHPLLPHEAVRWIVLGNAILTGVIAAVKRNNPPGPPPTKST
jgi:hypothetical protein